MVFVTVLFALLGSVAMVSGQEVMVVTEGLKKLMSKQWVCGNLTQTTCSGDEECIWRDTKEVPGVSPARTACEVKVAVAGKMLKEVKSYGPLGDMLMRSTTCASLDDQTICAANRDCIWDLDVPKCLMNMTIMKAVFQAAAGTCEPDMCWFTKGLARAAACEVETQDQCPKDQGDNRSDCYWDSSDCYGECKPKCKATDKLANENAIMLLESKMPFHKDDWLAPIDLITHKCNQLLLSKVKTITTQQKKDLCASNPDCQWSSSWGGDCTVSLDNIISIMEPEKSAGFMKKKKACNALTQGTCGSNSDCLWTEDPISEELECTVGVHLLNDLSKLQSCAQPNAEKKDCVDPACEFNSSLRWAVHARMQTTDGSIPEGNGRCFLKDGQLTTATGPTTPKGCKQDPDLTFDAAMNKYFSCEYMEQKELCDVTEQCTWSASTGKCAVGALFDMQFKQLLCGRLPSKNCSDDEHKEECVWNSAANKCGVRSPSLLCGALTSSSCGCVSDCAWKASGSKCDVKVITTTSVATTTAATAGATTTAVATEHTGSLDMTVPDPAAFKDDAVAKNAVVEALAGLFGVPASYIQLIVKLVGDRRLDIAGRRLTGKVKVDYTVTIPPDSSVTAAKAKENMNSKSLDQVTTAVQSKVQAAKGSDYAVAVTSKSTIATATKPHVETNDAQGTYGLGISGLLGMVSLLQIATSWWS